MSDNEMTAAPCFQLQDAESVQAGWHVVDHEPMFEQSTGIVEALPALIDILGVACSSRRTALIDRLS